MDNILDKLRQLYNCVSPTNSLAANLADELESDIVNWYNNITATNEIIMKRIEDMRTQLQQLQHIDTILSSINYILRNG
jgi:hypothetical protein